MNIISKDNDRVYFASKVVSVDKTGKVYVDGEEVEAATKKDDDLKDLYRCLPYELGQVTLNGEYKTNLIYKIVYLTFSGENKPIVHHKFGNKLDDSITNLVGCDTIEEHHLYELLEKLYGLFNNTYEMHNVKSYSIKDNILPLYNYKCLQDLDKVSFISGDNTPSRVREICNSIRYNGNLDTTIELMDQLAKENIVCNITINALSKLSRDEYTNDKSDYKLDISFENQDN